METKNDGARYSDVFLCLDALKEPGEGRELTKSRERAAIAAQSDDPVYLGAGYYDHLIPTQAERLVAEIEFHRQSSRLSALIGRDFENALNGCNAAVRRLTGASHAEISVYFGGSALCRGATLASRATGRRLILASESLGAPRLAELCAAASAASLEVRAVESRNGLVDVNALRKTLYTEGDRVAATIVGYPNFYGLLERLGQISESVKAIGALLMLTVDPVALAALRSPADWGADITVCDAHTAPIHSSEGDARLGFIACSDYFFKATSSVDVFRTLRDDEMKGARMRGALRTLAHLAYTEPQELRRVSERSRRAAQYARQSLLKAGFRFQHEAPFWREFAVKTRDPKGMLAYLDKWGIVGGYELPDGILLAFTEKRSVDEIDELVYFMKRFEFEEGRESS